MADTAKTNEPRIDWQKLIIKPLELHDGETGKVKFYRVIRKVEQLIKQHNALVEIARQQCEQQRGPALLSDEKAMPSGELQPVDRCSPPSEPKPTSFDELRERFCRCVVPTIDRTKCSECGLPIYDEGNED